MPTPDSNLGPLAPKVREVLATAPQCACPYGKWSSQSHFHRYLLIDGVNQNSFRSNFWFRPILRTHVKIIAPSVPKTPMNFFFFFFFLLLSV